MLFNKFYVLVKSGNILRVTLLAGIIFFVITSGVITAFFLLERSSSKILRKQENFTRMLSEYDLLAEVTAGSQKEFERLDRELDRIEKRAISVESWLSVLKRRRALSRFFPPSTENYHKSVFKAQDIFPASQPIAAIASEILVKNIAITRETEETLRKFISLFTDNSFNTLRICLHVLLGDFNNPQRAEQIPSELLSDGTESVSIDLTILRIIRGDIRAAGDVQTMLQSEAPSDNILRLAAEYYYDFGDINRSAELFSLINDEKALVRQADALFLAGFFESARSIWSILSDSYAPVERSLYNLGVTSKENEEAVFWYEKLMNLETAEISESRQYGLIRYSRLLETPQALALLQNIENLQPSLNPYIDLEICKRQAPWWELGRQIAETWLLLDRHDNNKDLYLWAAWLFLFQRNFNEIKILLNRMEIFDLTWQWVKVYRAINLMFEGDLDTAEESLRSILPEYTEWSGYANLGCILEAQRSSRRALEQYELASEKTENPKTASRLQVRMARCYTALNQPLESLRSLENAIELDPGNLTAKLELDRAIFSY